MHSVRETLDRPKVPGIDASLQPQYGHQKSVRDQTTLYLTPLHGRADVLKRLLANIGKAVRHVSATAEQFKDLDRWGCLLRYISDHIAPVIGPPSPPTGLPTAR
ncbi:hypothetical protein LCC91_11540 [Tepidimonas taiwanensis]|uniref:Uncharacterized protein n=1 Tax=Tepidimonas taiwanensis TaxID=307486 RepID=A0A554X461_9BURK|nr:hypothetical protein [Tepidimonas taiwanensis]MCX7693329.1 hypothetical protein [Tepidimonas taiwanensis]MDM7463509.1 hypothetical protein [Tepidimonas taiwanensis]TSE30593.1 hypothetical protein Ttaiw_01850 [Tepidimonas taiwanensis]UBQ05162.1 hypothetical protein LCC91_11540 [Tepidimonas taiwanensis]